MIMPRLQTIHAALLDHMGSDLTVVNAARVSFDKESDLGCSSTPTPIYPGAVCQGRDQKGFRWLREEDANLIRFLATGYRSKEWDELRDDVRSCEDDTSADVILHKHKNKAQHWAPFAHPQVSLRVSMPVFLARQMVKHQVGGVWSEVSRRYISGLPEYWAPERWHTRPEDVKQGSGNDLDESTQKVCDEVLIRHTKRADAAYQTLLAEGVAPEEARIVLPLNTMTTVVWTGSLLFWARVCNQRLDGHAQLAAQELAQKVSAIIKPLYPVSWEHLVGGI